MGLPAETLAGLFAEGGFEEREVELADGTRATLWFRHLPNSIFERYAKRVRSGDEEVAAQAHAWLLSVGVCGPDGSDALTAEQADRIKRPIALQMLDALMRVNAFDQMGADRTRNEAGN
jgi:hypothetical protein